MEKILRWFFSRSRMTVLLGVVAVIMGFNAYTSLPRQVAPEIDIPIVSVTVPAPGMAPEDVDKSIILPLESELFGISGLKEIKSSAREGSGSLTLEFSPGWNEGATLNEVERRVSRAQLPDQAESPVSRTIDFSENPVISVAIIATGAGEKTTHME